MSKLWCVYGPDDKPASHLLHEYRECAKYNAAELVHDAIISPKPVSFDVDALWERARQLGYRVHEVKIIKAKGGKKS